MNTDMNLGVPKMLGYSSVAERLVASEDGVIFMELVNLLRFVVSLRVFSLTVCTRICG
jgi:hypothetical protein